MKKRSSLMLIYKKKLGSKINFFRYTAELLIGSVIYDYLISLEYFSENLGYQGKE